MINLKKIIMTSIFWWCHTNKLFCFIAPWLEWHRLSLSLSGLSWTEAFSVLRHFLFILNLSFGHFFPTCSHSDCLLGRTHSDQKKNSDSEKNTKWQDTQSSRHLALCIFLMSGMHLSLFSSEHLMCCMYWFSFNWCKPQLICNWHDTFTQLIINCYIWIYSRPWAILVSEWSSTISVNK